MRCLARVLSHPTLPVALWDQFYYVLISTGQTEAQEGEVNCPESQSLKP